MGKDGFVTISFPPFFRQHSLPLMINGWSPGQITAVSKLKPLSGDKVTFDGKNYKIRSRKESVGIVYLDDHEIPYLVYGNVPYPIKLSTVPALGNLNSYWAVKFPLIQDVSTVFFAVDLLHKFNEISVLEREIAMCKFYYSLPDTSPVATPEEEETYRNIYHNELRPFNLLDGSINYTAEDFSSATRYDLTDRTIYTVDGSTTKDIDDAVEVTQIAENRYLIGIHIADVTEFVADLSPRDVDARSRATSTYIADRVIHMLPTCLSQEYCSLNENVRRLAVSVFVEIVIGDSGYRLKGMRVAKSLIRSDHKLTYEMVNQILEKRFEGRVSEQIRESLEHAKVVSEAIEKYSTFKGGSFFGTMEAKYYETDAGVQCKIKEPASRSDKLIEMFMVTTNNLVGQKIADAIVSMGISPDGIGAYRAQEVPDEQRIRQYISKLKQAGVIRSDVEFYQLHADALKEVNDDATQNNSLSVAERNDGVLAGIFRRIIALLDRTDSAVNTKLGVLGRIGSRPGTIMKKALLTGSFKSSFHHSLGISRYAWFTSPIRRYSDVVNHRQIKSIISNDAVIPNQVNLSKLSKTYDISKYAQKDLDRRLLMFYLRDCHEICKMKELTIQINSFEWSGLERFRIDGIWKDCFTLRFEFVTPPDARISNNGLTCTINGLELNVTDTVTVNILDSDEIAPDLGTIHIRSITQITLC